MTLLRRRPPDGPLTAAPSAGGAGRPVRDGRDGRDGRYGRSAMAAAGAALALALTGGALLWACGPFFPNWLLDDEKLVLDGPTARFDDEIRRLFPPPPASATPAAGAPHAQDSTTAGAASAAPEPVPGCPAAPDGMPAPTGGAAAPGAGPSAAGGDTPAPDTSPGGADDPHVLTARIDCQELAQTLAGAGLPVERQRSLLAAYGAVRGALLRQDLAAENAAEGATTMAPSGEVPAAPSDASPRSPPSGEVPPTPPHGGASPTSAPGQAPPAPAPGGASSSGGASAASPSGEPPAAALAIPSGLPPEFADYLEGALAYRAGRLDAARAAWQRLLDRPAAERRRRSTWAAFMLGKAALRSPTSPRPPAAPHSPAAPRPPAAPGSGTRDRAHLDAAVRWFRTTRDLAAHGFADRLRLASASFGWEARAEADRGRDDRAMALYAAQARAGDPTAATSLRFLARAALAAGGPTLLAAAREPAARDTVTALVLAHGIEPPWDLAPGEKAPPPPARAWFAAVRAAGLRQVAGADRIAWAAYLAGDFAGAADWLRRADPASAASRWVRARLLLRRGRLAEAEALLQGLGSLPAAAALADPEGPAAPTFAPGDPYLATPARALGEAGAAAVARGDFTAGLDHLLRAGYWLDAAYLGERVLSTAELRAYVDRGWPASLAEGPATTPANPEGGMIWSVEEAQRAPSAPQVARAIRYLLGRRLVRDHQPADARPYLPASLRPRLDALDAAARAGADGSRPAAARAADLFTAACITRYQGLELLGTEIEPDWEIFDGAYDPGSLAGNLAARAKNRILRPTVAELARAGHPTVRPWKRFHYRYLGAALARSAADLLPAGSPDRAAMLVTAGRWLAERDPHAAQPFYAALESCCGQTELGRAAARLRWLPKADACPAAIEAPIAPEGAGTR